MAMKDYLVGEVTEEYAEGLLSRREAVRRLSLLGVGLPAAAALLTACGDDDAAETSGPGATPEGPIAPQASAPPGKDVGKLITFKAGGQSYRAAFKAAETPKGAVLVIHEN